MVFEDRIEVIKGIRRVMVKVMIVLFIILYFGYKDEVILNEFVR